MSDDFVYAIGLMSGTSLDGLDIVHVKFKKNDYTFFEILSSKTVSYSKAWRNRLQNAIGLDKEDISILDSEYGIFLGKQAREFIDQDIEAFRIKYLGSKGLLKGLQPKIQLREIK